MLIPVKQTDKNDSNATHVHITVMHLRGRGMAVVDITPVRREGTLTSFLLCSGKSRMLERVPRLSKKRITALEQDVKAQIEAKAGIAWDLLQTVLTGHGLAVDEAPIPA